MATKSIVWDSGGTITLIYGGQGNGSITVQTDSNPLHEARSKTITIETTAGSPKKSVTITVSQAMKPYISLNNAVVTASNQTYNGQAKTPAPTVTLNGETVPSTGYDVAYSNNTNAGTATITITGKGDYNGSATGTFTIAKASRTLSFSNSYAVIVPSGTVTKTATPSAGSGDGAITYSVGSTTYATVNASSGKVTAKTTEGSTTITASIAEGDNYLAASESYILYVFSTTHNYSYSGSAQNLTLPPGTYKFQVWGAQGGSCSDGFSGGKGGYSEGQLTIGSQTAIKVRVGGQGGWNGGGSSSGSASYSSGDTYGRSSMGNGGGATDIRLSDDALLSRMIVAGGGGGGAYGYKEVTTETSHIVTDDSFGVSGNNTKRIMVVEDYYLNEYGTFTFSGKYSGSGKPYVTIEAYRTPGAFGTTSDYRRLGQDFNGNNYMDISFEPDSSYPYISIYLRDYSGGNVSSDVSCEVTLSHEETDTQTSEDYDYQYGYAGGGATGQGYNSNYQGRQNTAGSGGSFGQGANQGTTNYRFCSGAGGGGWYGGGGGEYSDNDMNYVHYSGGGSGFVNTAANASYRPSGYTGLQLDSGNTYAGNTSFESTSGGTETGHSGNGYARITRIS